MSAANDDMNPYRSTVSQLPQETEVSATQKRKKLAAQIEFTQLVEGMFWMAWLFVILVVAPIVSAIAWFFYN